MWTLDKNRIDTFSVLMRAGYTKLEYYNMWTLDKNRIDPSIS